MYVKCGKPTPLGPKFDGPFKIIERLGNSTIKVRVASYANGQPRYETHHWASCKPAVFLDEPFETERTPLGRKRVQK